MGLDMYLTAKKYLSNYDEKEKAIAQDIQQKLETEYIVREVELEVMYWRKANAIHKWFVDNVQEGTDDCGYYHVTEEKLKELFETVKKALITPEIILPTQGGFFFGSTEYNEGYTQDLMDTRLGLEKLLSSKELKDMDFYYHSSW